MLSNPQTTRLECFSDLVHQIYAASAEPSRWPATVGAVTQAMGATRALLFTPFVEPASGGLLFPWQIDERDLMLWGSKYISHDIWARNAQSKGLWRDGSVALDQDLITQEEFLDSIFYREFLSTMNVGRVCVGVAFEGAPGLPSTALSVFREPDAPFGNEEREFMRLLVPHLSRALGLMHRLNRAAHLVESMRAALDRLQIGVILLNHHMAAIHVNATAQQVLDRNDGLRLDAKHCITAPGFQRRDGLRLEAWLARIAVLPTLSRGSFGDTFEVARIKPKTTYSVQCHALETTDPLARHEGARHIVFITDPHRLELPAPDQLQRQFGLTPAEARVALAMAQGGSYNDVATTFGVSEETIRSQIRATYAKTHTSDKASLARLVLSLSKATA